MCKTSKMALKFARFVILRPFVPSLSTSRSITSTRLACDAKKDVAEAIDPTPIRQRVHRRDLRFMFPEFLPDPEPSMRNKLVEKMQRKDMLKRRQMVEIPEFYVGSIIAVTVADPNSPSPNKQSRFLGIVIERGGSGLRAYCVVRNVIDQQGIEFLYYIYSPQVQKIETIRLEKRLDDELIYLRDAPLEYSTFPEDMEPEILPEGTTTPINDLVVPLKDSKWTQRWETRSHRYKGYSISPNPPYPEKRQKALKKAEMYLGSRWTEDVLKYDLMLHYRETIPLEEQDAIWAEVGDELEARDKVMKRVATKRAFSKASKRK